MTNRKNWPVGLSTSHFGALAGREAGVFAEYRRAGIRIAEPALVRLFRPHSELFA